MNVSNLLDYLLLAFVIILFIIQCFLVGYQSIKTYGYLFDNKEHENGKRD